MTDKLKEIADHLQLLIEDLGDEGRDTDSEICIRAHDALRNIIAQALPAVEAAEIERLPDSEFQDEFQAWWEDEGQYVRAGGGNYERSFAFQAWRHLMPTVTQHRRILAGVNQQSEFCVESDLLRSALGFCGIAAPESDEELGFNSASYAKKVVRKLAKINRAVGVNQQAGSGVPEGWRPVPLEPTPEMVNVLLQKLIVTNRGNILNPKSVLLDVILAAPLPPSPAAKAGEA